MKILHSLKKYFATFFISVFLVLFFSASFKSYAQCPPNIDFEYGNFSYWAYSYGNSNSLYPSQATPIPFALRDTTPIMPLKVDIITPFSATTIDPYGGFPTLCPNGSNSSVRLGNDYIGAEMDLLQYKFNVPSTSTNYSITYQYAVVLQNPTGHTASEQPRFRAIVKDSATGLEITCATRDFISDLSLPGFFISPTSYDTAGVLDLANIILCRGWTPTSINLKGYAGHTIYLTFIAFDCTKTGHFGYAYIDVNSQCGSNAIINSYCWNSTSATLSAPDGFKTYRWYNASLTTLFDTIQTPTIPLPSSTTTYGVICAPYPGYGCTDTFFTTLTPVLPPKPIADFSVPSTYCASSILNFTDLSSSNIAGISVTKYKWDFGDPNATGNSAPPNPDTSLLQNPQHLYSDTGTYTVKLAITTAAGCTDTIIKNIRIALPPPNVPITTSSDSVCAVVDTVTLNWTGSLAAGFTPIWSLNPGTNLVSGNLVSTGPIVVSFDTIGMNYIGFTVVPPLTNDSTCWAHKNIAIYAKGFYPKINIMGIDTVCYGNATKLFFDVETESCKFSKRSCNSPDSYTIGTTLTPNSTQGSPLSATSTFPKCRSQYLFNAADLLSFGLTTGAIKGIGFTVTTKNSTTAFQGFTIKIACVNYNTLNKTTPFTFDTLSTKTLVYSANSYSSVLGLNQFVFDTAFAWNGTSNLLIEMCYDNTGFTTTGLFADAVKKVSMPAGIANSVVGIATIAETEAACSKSFPLGLASSHFISAYNARPQFNFLACNGSYIPTGTTYSWTSNPSGFSSTLDSVFVAPTTTTTYFVTASNFGCTNSDSIKIAVFNTTIKAGNDTTLCFTGSQKTLTLASSVTGNGPFNYSWSVSPSSASILNSTIANPTVIVQANTIDTFVVSMTSATCTIRDTMIVYASAKPTITKTKDSLICLYDTIQLSLSSNQLNTTYAWTSNYDTLSCYTCYNPTAIITQNDTFNFVATNAYGCTTLEKIRVNPKPIPTATFTATTPVCPNSNSTLTYTGNAGNGATYNWNFVGGIATPGGVLQGPQFVHWAVSDTYNIVLSVTKNNCTSLKDTQSVIVLPIPASTFTANNAHCVGDTLVLTYTGNGASMAGADPLWIIPASATIVSGSIVSFGPIKLIPAVGSSIYSLAVNVGSCVGIAFKDTILITANPLSTFSVTSPICLNAKSNITYTGNASTTAKFNWNFDAGTSTINDTLVGPHAVQWLSFGAKNVSLWVNENGCISDTTIHPVQVLQTPTARFSTNAAHCNGDTIELIYTGNGKTILGSVASWIISPAPTYLVGNATTFDTIKFVPSVGNTIINLIVSNGTCADTLKDTISIYSIPDNLFTIDSLICMNANTTINYTGLANVSATYNWSYDGATATPGGIVKGPHTVNWASFGTKNISLSVSENGCTSAIDTQQIRVLQLPTASFTINNAHCFGDTLQLIYAGNAKTISGSTAKWSITPTPLFILGDTTTIDTILFVPGVGNTIIGLTISNKICSVVSKDTVSIFNYPTNTFTATSPVCPNQNSILNYTGNATLGATYNWNYDGGIAGINTVKWNTSGNYNVSLSVTQNGCTSAIDTLPVVVLQVPTAIFAKSVAHCIGDTITLIYTGNAKTIVGANLKWIINPTPAFLIGDTTTMDTVQFVPTIGNTIVQLIASNSTCSSSFFDTTIIYQYPTNTFTLSNDTACTPSTSLVTYTGSALATATYNWNFNSLSTAPGGTTKGPHTITIPNAGNYNISLFVTENGCTSNTLNHAIKVYQSPAISILKNNPHCKGDTLTLNYSSPSVAFPTWIIPTSSTLLSGSLTGNTALTVLLDTGMNYFSVSITDGICTSTAIDSIRIYKIPTSTFTINPTTNCTALASTLTYTGNASNTAIYNWNFASGTATPGGTTKNQSVIWSSASNYAVELTVSENGCTSTLSSNSANVLLSPTSTFTKNNPHCAGDTLMLTYSGNAALVLGATALWNIPSGATLVNGSLNSFSPIKVILPTGMNHFGLTITNSICTSSAIDSIRIYQIPTSSFTIGANPTCQNQPTAITYTGSATSSANYNWIFTNGIATPGGTTAPQSVTWSNINNTNLVSLSVSENGCTSNLTSTNVAVLEAPTASISKNNTTCAGDTLILNYSGNGQTISGATALWSFTNNPIIISGNINSFGTIMLIPKSGKTVATITVSNGSCVVHAKDSVLVTAIPTASFSFTNASICANSNVVFTYNGNAPSSATYNWNFNGGNATPGGTVKGPQTVNWAIAGNKTVTLQVLNNGCSSNVGSTNINVIAIPITSFTVNPTQICSGANAIITYTGSNTATAYNWTASGTHTPSVLSGKGPHNIKYTNATSAIKTEMIILKVTQNGCTSYPDTNYVSVVPLPIASFTTNSPICPIDTLHVTFTGSNLLPTANFNWSFTGNNGSIGSGVGPYLINYANSGKYEITLSITQNNCTSLLHVDSITILPEPIVHIYQDTTICEGNPVTLMATGANTYVWDNSLGTNASITVSPTITTTYKVVGTNGSCSAVDVATISVSSYPIAYAGRDTMIPVNGNIELGTTNTIGYAYSWSPSTTLNNAALSNPIAQPTDSTMYIVTVSNSSGCIALDSVIILVGRCYNPAIANTFTPNGDGENDNFRILNAYKLKSVEKFEIFNRWGEKIFSSNDKQNTTWDGTYHGVLQEIGTYVYVLQATCLNDEKISIKGTVELIR